MFNYVVKRVLVAIPTLLILIVLSFVLMHAAPGSPFTKERPLPPQVLANIEAKYGLDQPLWKQIPSYTWGVVTRFDFGPSFVYKDRSVNEIIAESRLPALPSHTGLGDGVRHHILLGGAHDPHDDLCHQGHPLRNGLPSRTHPRPGGEEDE